MASAPVPSRRIPALRPTLTSVLALGLLCAGAAPSAAQFNERRVPAWASMTGFVWDSTTASPLEGARVILVGAGIEGSSGPDGMFRIDSIPPGTYPVSFSHERVAGSGFTMPTIPVQFLADDSVVLDLAIPSIPTLLGSRCVTQASDSQMGALVGSVRDAATEVPLSRARVTLSWYGNQTEYTADWDGVWIACGVPVNAQVSGEVRFPGREAETFVIRGVGDPLRRVDVELDSGRRGTIFGRVVDRETLEPVNAAEVRLPDADRVTVTDEDGRFMIPDLEPGAHAIAVSHVAYGDDQDEVRVPDDERILDLTVRLAPRVIELEGIVVEAASAEMQARLAQGTRFDGMGFQEIQDVLPRVNDMEGLLRAARIPGLISQQTATGLCVELNRARGRNSCNYPQLYVDGVRIENVSDYLEQLSPERVERFQVLSALEAGALYGSGSQAGVIVIHTRAGRVPSIR